MRSLLAAVAVSATLLLTSCFNRSEGVPLEEDLQLSAQIAELRRTGATRPLIELVPGDWDTVYMARDPVSREDIEQAVGQPIDMPDYITYGNILVFMNQDSVVRAVRIEPVQIHPGTRLVVKYTSAVLLVAPRSGHHPGLSGRAGQPVSSLP